MKTPTQEQFQIVIDNLEKANKMANNNAKIDMMQGTVKREQNLCGTPVCFGGWYCIGKGLSSDNYSHGAYHIANDLGFDNECDLKLWASTNIGIWGNNYGKIMFCDGLAFGKKEDTGFTLKTIINHWKGVKERAAKLQ